MPDTVKDQQVISRGHFEDAPALAATKRHMEANLRRVAEAGEQHIVGPVIWHEPEPLAFQKDTAPSLQPPSPLWMLPDDTEPEMYGLRCEAETADA